MIATKGAYESAIKKLSLPLEVLYDERGIIYPEYILTDSEKDALLFYVQNDMYIKKDKDYHDPNNNIKYEFDSHPSEYDGKKM